MTRNLYNELLVLLLLLYDRQLVLGDRLVEKIPLYIVSAMRFLSKTRFYGMEVFRRNVLLRRSFDWLTGHFRYKFLEGLQLFIYY